MGVARGSSGKGRLVFDQSRGFGPVIEVPCGQCVGCRLERSRQWAVRCVHEASLWEANCFLTLTYAPEHLPALGSLDKRDFQLFMKRLRERVGFFDVSLWQWLPRYFHCGEYGERNGRPHYHACLFGFDFPDRVLFKTVRGVRLYTSVLLDEVWGLGQSTIGDVTFESAAYVARYVMKKVTGPKAPFEYSVVDESTGELYLSAVEPEYVTMSRRPGIAHAWYEKFGSEVFPSDEVIVRGHSCRPPRYYSKIFEAAHADLYEDVKRKRRAEFRKHLEDATPERLAVQETCANARVSLLRRSLGEES